MGWVLMLGGRVAEAQLTISSITPSAVTNTPGTVATYNANYTWPNLTLSATGAIMTITVPSPVQNTASNNLVLVGNPQITNSFYNPTNQTIYFQFVSPLPAGSAGTVQFQPYLRNDGTVTNGSTATFVATFAAVGQTPATNRASLKAGGVTDNATLTQTLLGKGTITTNSLISYQISPRNANPSLNITNWSMVDLLPPHVVYVSSSPAGVYDSVAGTVTWTSNSTPFNVGYSPSFTVAVYAPSASFAVGNSLTNRVTTTNLFLDGNTVVKSATNTTALTAPAVGFDSVAKTSSGWNGLFNSPFTWAIAWRARANDTATTLTVTDPLPPAFVPTAINPSFPDVGPAEVYVQYQTKNNTNWASLPGSPFTVASATDANNKTYYLTNLHLGLDVVTGVQWTYTNVSPLATFNSGDIKPTLTGSITNVDRNGNTVSPTAVITNYTTLVATYYGTNVPVGTTSNSVTLAVAAPLVSVGESTSSGNPAQPGQTNAWKLSVANNATASDNLTNPVVADLLPLSLQYVPGSATGAGGNLTLTNTVVSTNYNGTGRTLVKLLYSGYLKPNNTAVTTIQTYVSPGVVPGTVVNALSLIGWVNATINSSSPWVADTNNLNGTGNTNLVFPTVSGTLTITAAAAASSVKRVKGQLNSGYVGYPQYGSSYAGGPISYQETISNPGNVTLTNITVVDILPYVGDVGVLATNQARGSAWQPFLTGPVSGPSGVTVYYSPSTNPYRPEMLGTNTPGSPSDWTTTLPSDLSTVRALKFAFGPTNLLSPLDSVQLTWTLQTPANAVTNSFAYNSFAYTATPAMSNTSPLVSEPNQVGIVATPTQPAFLGDYVWNDANQNGIQDAGEAGINGVRVELYAAGASRTAGAPDNTFLQFVLTAPSPTGAAGYYQFPYLSPSNYFVKVIPPATYAISPQRQGSNTNLDSDFNPATGWSDLITLATGATNESVDCGVYYTGNASVGAYVWIDRNGNGLQDEGSIDGLNGVTVQIYAVTALATNLYAGATTAFDSFGNPGYYHFYNLPPGQYQIRFVPPAGDTFTLREANGANSGNGSEANSAGWTSVFTLTGGQVNNTWNAGIMLPSGPLSVGRMVWYDPNADARYDFFGGERGINNAVVSLYWDTDNNGVFTPGTDQLFSSTLTSTLGGEPGNYSFNNLPPGNFIVVLEAINFQPGGALYGLTNDPVWVPDAPGYLDNVNKGVPVGSYIASTAFPLVVGSEPTTPNSNLTLDFGLTYLTNLCAVGSTVFLDSNQDGKQDNGEAGIAGVGVQLWRLGSSGAVGGSDAVLVASTNTDASGNYLFANLPPTNYFIEIPTPPTTGGAVSPVVYTGNQKDGYNHGTQPNGYNTAVFGPSFTLSPGTEPTDTIETAQGGTLDNALPGGDANGDMTEDFGLFDSSSLVAIGNTVFNDLNANGRQDAGEPGISGVGLALVRVVGGVNNVVGYTTSGTNGHYKFDLLSPGTYQVVVLATNFQTGASLTNFLSSPGAVTGAAPDSYVDDHGIDNASAAVNGIHSAVYDLELGTAPSAGTNGTPVGVPGTNANLTIDFGFTPTYSLGNRVFADNGVGGGTMNNGIQDGSEPGISNVVVKLFAADGSGNPTGSALATNTTDGLGYYRFDTLLAGTYVVVVDTIASGQSLGGLASSTGWNAGLTAADDQTDHGIDVALGASSVLPGGIASVPVTLGAGLQPIGEADLGGSSPNPPRGNGPSGDGNDNLVIDFGFTPAYSIANALVSVDQPAAGAGGTQVTPGGLVTSGLLVGLPEGSVPGLTVVAQVPTGMQYVSSRVVTTAAGSSNLLSANFGGTIPIPVVTGGTGNGSAVTWTFGAISVPGIVPTSIQYFVVLITMQALDVSGNTGMGAQTVLANSASCAVTGQPPIASASVNVTVVEPAMGLAETITPATTDAEGIVTVTLVATNSGTSTAYSVNVQDVLAGTNFDLGTVSLGTAGVNYPDSFTASYSASSGTILYSGGSIGVNASATLSFTVKLAATVVPGSIVTNGVFLTQAATLPGGAGRHEPGAGATATVAVYTRSVGGYVYADANNNGAKDNGEIGLAGVSVALTGTDATGHAVALTNATAADGSYLFTNLAPGIYTLTRGSTPSGYLDGKETAGSGFGGSVNNTALSAIISGVTISGGSGQSGANYNFALIQPNSLSGLVFSDQNNDGIMNGGDFGISNVVVVLSGTSDWGSVSTTNNTLADGTYSFPNLRPGSYTITETQPAAFGQGRNVPGTAGGVNSATDVFSAITLTPNQAGTGYNFAELPASLAGTVFMDLNYNHALDAGEGLAGVRVVLTGTNLLGQTMNLTSTTVATGAYGFSNLLAGYYTVQVQTNTLAVGMLQDVDPDAVLDSATSVSLSGGVTDANLNFGYDRSDPYRTQADGDWNNPAIWQRWDGLQWTNATVAPTYTDGVIQVMPTNTVRVTGGVVADQLRVEGSLVIQPGAVLLLASNSLPGLELHGVLTNWGTLTLDPNTQAIVGDTGMLVNSATVNSATTNLWFVGGTYVHACTTDAGAIPLATWLSSTNHSATCQVDGYTTNTTAPLGLNQSFLNFVWSCAGQTAEVNLGAGFAAADNFTIASTGAGGIALGAALTVTNQTLVSTGAELDCGTNVLSGGSFNLVAGATLGIGSRDGITAAGNAGNLQTTNNRFSSSANYVYDGAVAQAAGSGLPAVVNSLAILNTQGTVTLAQATTIGTVVSLANSARLSLPAGTTSSAASFVVGGNGKSAGSWGSTSSQAWHQNDAYFAATTGLLNVSVGIPAAFSGLSSNQVIVYGTSHLLLGGTLNGPGSTHPPDGEIVTIQIDGHAQTTMVSGGNGAFSMDYASANLQHSNFAPHTITYSYAGDDNLNGAADASTSVQVQSVSLTPAVTLNNKVYDGTTNAATIATRRLEGIVGTDDVALGGSGLVAGFPSRNVGSYPGIAVTGLSLSGSTAGNYQLAGTSVVAGASITPRPLTVTAGTNVKAYDGTTSATNLPSITTGGLMAGDNAGFSVAYATPGVGKGKTLMPSGTVADGNGGTNYGYTFMASSGGEIDPAATQVKLISSSPTNGYRASVFFTATNLPTDAGSNVIFSANGVPFSTNVVVNGGAGSLAITNLPRGNTNAILATYTGDNNYLSSYASLIQVVTNHPPAARELYYVRTAGLLLRVFWSQLSTNWSDADGDAITAAGISLYTTNNVLLATNSLQILYPASAPNVNDRFGYVIRDSYGDTNTAYVNVVVNPFVTGQPMTLSRVNPGSITYFGHPGYAYVLQRTTNLFNTNAWVNLSTNTIGANGQVTVVDHFTDLGGVVPAQASYRVGWRPAY